MGGRGTGQRKGKVIVLFKSSVTIATVSGIPIRLHVSFLLILPFFALVIGNNIETIAGMAGVTTGELSVSPYVLGLILALLLFVSVALHELAHAFVARSQGIGIRDITLMLLGGVAQMEDEIEERGELWVALAGPLFSLVFGGVLLFLLRPLAASLAADVRLVIYYLGFMNVFLAFFNMLPAFPSDGGRVLRSLLARHTTFLQATRIATSVGKIFAFAFAIIGLLSGHLILILIAFFIYIGASQEYQFNVVRDAFSEFKVSDLMTHEVSTVHPDLPVAELLELMLQERHSGYPVVDDEERLVGCVTMYDIQSVPKDAWESSRINEIMTCEVIHVAPGDDLFSAFKRISEADIGRLMVVQDGDLKGIITRSDIMKAYRLRTLQEEQTRVGP